MTATPAVEEGIDTPKQGQRRASEPGVSRLPPSPRAVVIITLLVRMVLFLVQHIHSHIVGESGFNSVPYGGNDDGRYYYTTAEQLADGIEPPFVLNFFPRVLAVLMDLGIRDLLALKLISFAVSSIAVVITASMAWHMSYGMRLAVRRWAVVVASVLGGLLPSSVFWSTNSLMRDGWILSFVLIAIWSFSDAGKGSLPRIRWALGLVALVAASSFRPYVLPVFVAALVSSRFDVLNPMRHLKPRLGPALVRLTLLALGFIGVCLLSAPVITDITGFNILAWRTREELLNWGSSMGLGFVGENPLTVVGFYLYSFVSNAIGPLPFQVKSAIHLVAFVEVPFFIVIAAGLLRANYNNRLLRFCALFGLYWLLLLGLWNDVIGNSSRNRIIAWPILAIAAAPAIAQLLSERFLQPVEPRVSRAHRRRFDRRTKRRRVSSSEAELHDSLQQPEQETLCPVSSVAVSSVAVSSVAVSSVAVSSVADSDVELAEWLHIAEEGKMPMRRSDNDRRLADRRDTNHDPEPPEDDDAASDVSTEGSVDNDGDSEQSSTVSDRYSVEPGGDVAESDQADVEYQLFKTQRRIDRSTSVVKVSRSPKSGRKGQ